MDGQITFTNTRMFFQGGQCTVDPQGRLFFPKVWRLPSDDNTTSFVLTPGLDRSIHIYTPEIFQNIYQKAITAPAITKIQNHFSIYARHCQMITLDKQSRFPVQSELLQYAGITNKAEYVGAITYGRIFSPERWDQISRFNNPAPVPTDEEIKLLSPEDQKLASIAKALDFIGTL